MKASMRLPILALAAATSLIAAPWALAQHFSEWLDPVNLGSPVNSALFEVCPAVTRDGLSLYFGSNRPGGLGAVDIYVSQRSSVTAPWGAPVTLGALVNSSSNENCPFVTPDGHTLLFLSNRPGSLGIDLYASTRRNKHDDLAWETPVPVAALNTPFNEFGPSGYQDENTGDLILFFTSDRPGGPGATDIYTTRRAGDGTLLSPTLVAELSTSAADQFSSVRKDGRELFLASDRPGTLGSFDFWVSSRASSSDPWDVPKNLGPLVNSTAFDQRPAFSWDALTLIFSSNRNGNFDLYETTRTRTRPAK
jgi:Tol biopolymer transport system component